MKLSALTILLFFHGICNAQSEIVNLKTNADDNTLLWEISGKGISRASYLFGTFHLLCRDDIKFSPYLRQAVRNAADVYLELDLDDPATLFGGLMLMNMKGDKKLEDLYSADEYRRVAGFFKDSLKASVGLIQKMKPYFLVAMLYPKMMPCPTVSGVEEELMKLAKEDKKEIKGLETMAFQASLFDSIPYEKQAGELLKAIDSMAKSRIYFDSMTEAYKHQRMDEIEALIKNDDFGMDENLDILLDKRNSNWVEQLKSLMKKGSVFVAVGTGHLIGKTGLIALLRREGYTVRPLVNK